MLFSPVKFIVLTKKTSNSLFHLFQVDHAYQYLKKNTDLFKCQGIIGWMFPVKEKKKEK